MIYFTQNRSMELYIETQIFFSLVSNLLLLSNLYFSAIVKIIIYLPLENSLVLRRIFKFYCLIIFSLLVVFRLKFLKLRIIFLIGLHFSKKRIRYFQFLRSIIHSFFKKIYCQYACLEFNLKHLAKFVF